MNSQRSLAAISLALGRHSYLRANEKEMEMIDNKYNAMIDVHDELMITMLRLVCARSQASAV